jgi:transposase
LPKCPARSFHNRAPEHIPEALMPALGPILEQIGSLAEHIRQYERKLQECYPETKLLRQVEGIGPLTALTFVLSVEDPYRLEKSRSVGAYLGLVPGTDHSGDRATLRNASLRKVMRCSA